MNRIPITLLIALLALGLITTGCNLITGSDESDNDEPLPAAPSELNMIFGGYEPTDEEEGFGDPEILVQYSNDTEQLVDDEMATDPEVVQMEEMPETDVYFLRITWGHLEGEGTTQLDWSGTASVVNGAIVVRKTILFEQSDYIHRPREDRRVVEWTSITYNHLDGVSLIVFDPPSLLTDESVVNQFTIETAPFTHTFEMSELAELDTLITIDDDGNAIHLTGAEREPGFCRMGFMRGEWYYRGADWGEFRGGWISDDGEIAGHVVGIWGYDADGRNVLYGKYVDTDGNFMGLLRGTFGRVPDRDPRRRGGWMHGRWFDEDESPQGAFRGRWQAPTGRGRNGYFQALWGMECPEMEADVTER
jgi:hypothetical protein